MNKINNLSDHYVIIGFGRMGKALCVTLAYRSVVIASGAPHRRATIQ